jgi:signal transduction histidine kinase
VFALTVALVLSVQAARASANLAEMRSEFVSTVTHELKTPIANIRAINETVAAGRGTMEMSREYAQMAIQEAKRLTRLVDNLLAYARLTDIADAYSFEAVPLSAAVERALGEFAPHLAAFDVRVDIPLDMPPVRADPTALSLVLNNLLDNAIRYSKDNRELSIAARVKGPHGILTVRDRGIGIPHDDIPRVTRKFFRGRRSESSGSGLGLAIVDRIVADHAGVLEIHSAVGEGTTISLTFPLVRSV